MEEKLLEGMRAIFSELRQIRINQQEQTAYLKKIAEYFEGTQPAPNLRYPLDKFHSFDWEGIGASPELIDQDGVARVMWRGNLYTRRAPQNKYKEAIWFSRCTGKDENGDNQYERLITFCQMEAPEPLGQKVKRITDLQQKS